MEKLRTWLLTVLIVMTPSIANAAGLGRIAIQSSLGQRFHAEIDLVGTRKLDSLSANLASGEDYRRAGLDYNATTASLVVTLEKRPDGEPYIKVVSGRPVNDFVVTVLVDVTSVSGRFMRAYSVPLNPPVVQ
jgi:pilus assembly protein FimV